MQLGAASSASNGGGSTSLTMAQPSGVAQWDVLIAQVTARGGTGTTITAPSGWTLLQRHDSTTTLAQAMYYRIAGASEPASHTWTLSSSVKATGGIIAYKGVDSSDPVDVSGGQANPAGTSTTGPSLTTTAANGRLAGFFGIAAGTSFTPPTGMAEQFDVSGTGGTRTTSSGADEALGSAGATGIRSATTAASGVNIGQLVALKPPTLSFAASTSSGAESSTPALLTVSLSAASSLSTTVDYAVTAGTASGSGTDYTLASGTLTIAAGATSQDISIVVADDALDEDDETVEVSLSNPSNANLGSTAGHTYTIQDNDNPPTVAFSSASSRGSEGVSSVGLAVALSGASGKTIAAPFSASGSATGAGTDYSLASSPLTFSPGQTSKNVDVTVVDDASDEGDETISVTLGTPADAALGSTPTHTYTIQDNDPPTVTVTAGDATASEPGTDGGSFTVTRTAGDTSGALTVVYTVSGTATAGSDYASLTGSVALLPTATSAAIALTPLDDTASEPDETVILTLASDAAYAVGSPSSATVTIADNDPPTVTVTASDASAAEPGPNQGAFTVARTGQTGASLTVAYTISGSAASGTDYSSVGTSATIPAGATSSAVAVAPLDDGLDEPDETVILTLVSDPAYTVGSPSSATVTIADDDATPSVTLGLSGSPVAEASGSAMVTATLSAASAQEVTVGLGLSGSAVLGTDFSRSSASIPIPAGSTSATATLTALQDSLDEADETIVVDVDSVTNAVESGIQQVTATITDDDSPPSVTLGLSGSPLAEAGGAATVTSTLSAASGQDVTVSLAFSGAATLTNDYTRSASFLLIAAGSTAATLTLTAVQDALDEPEESVVVDVAAVTNGVESGTQQVTAVITDDDAAPTVTLGLSGSPAAEAGGVATVTATLSAASGQDVTVGLAFSGTATLTSDYTRSGTSIVISAGGATGAITLTGAPDALDEPDETVVVEISSVVNGVESGAQQVTATITDDDATPSIVLSLAGSPMAEAAGVATLTASLSLASSQDVTVGLAFSGTATLTSDYASPGSTIVISAGATTGTLALTALQDALDEPGESIIVDVSSVVNAVESGTQQVTAWITDDDPAPLVSLTLSGSPMGEAGGVATLTASVDAVSGQDVTVNLAFSGAASLTSDYSRSGSSILIPAGSTSGTATLTALQDALDEANETIQVDVSSVTNGLESGTQQVVASILDDDAPPGVTLSLAGSPLSEASGTATVTVTLSAVSGQSVGVDLALSGSATPGSDFSPASLSLTVSTGSLTATATLTALQDSLDEPTETIVVDIDTVVNGLESGTQRSTANLLDDDPAPIVAFAAAASSGGEGTSPAQLSVTLSAASGHVVSVDYSATGGTASGGGSDYALAPGTLSFNPGETSKSIDLTIVNDALDEPSESVVVALSNPLQATLGTPASHTYTIADNDPPAVTVTAPDGVASEAGPTTGTFSIARTTGDLSASLAVRFGISGSASAGTDYAALGSSATIPAGAAELSLTVLPVDDAVTESMETVVITLQSDAAYSLGPSTSATVRITDNDAAAVLVTPTSGLVTTEAGGTATFTIALGSAPTAIVAVPVTTGDATEGSITPSSVQFASTNWSTPQSIIVRGVDDAADDGDVAYQVITGPAVSDDPAYSSSNPPDVSVTNLDNDGAGFAILETGGSTAVSEPGTTDTFSIVLTAQPASGVVLFVTNSNPQEARLSPSFVSFSNASWTTPQAVLLTARDDTLVDGPQTATISVGVVDANSSDEFDALPDQSFQATIADDDAASTPAFTIAHTDGATGVSETTSSDLLRVALGARPTSDVVLSVRSSDLGEATASPSNLTFTPINWNLSQNVTVAGVDDLIVDGPQLVVVTFAVDAARSADEYDSLPNHSVPVWVADDDNQGIANWTQSLGMLQAAVPVPVGLPAFDPTGPAALTQMILQAANSTTSAVSFRTQILASLPTGTPPPSFNHVQAQIWELALTGSSPVSLSRASFRFTLTKSWLDSNCPAASCDVRVFHYRSADWETLTPTPLEENSTAITYGAETASLSPFVVGGVPRSSSGGGGGGGGGGAPASSAPLPAPPVAVVPAQPVPPPIPSGDLAPEPSVNPDVLPEPVPPVVVAPFREDRRSLLVALPALLVLSGAGVVVGLRSFVPPHSMELLGDLARAHGHHARAGLRILYAALILRVHAGGLRLESQIVWWFDRRLEDLSRAWVWIVRGLRWLQRTLHSRLGGVSLHFFVRSHGPWENPTPIRFLDEESASGRPNWSTLAAPPEAIRRPLPTPSRSAYVATPTPSLSPFVALAGPPASARSRDEVADPGPFVALFASWTPEPSLSTGPPKPSPRRQPRTSQPRPPLSLPTSPTSPIDATDLAVSWDEVEIRADHGRLTDPRPASDSKLLSEFSRLWEDVDVRTLRDALNEPALSLDPAWELIDPARRHEATRGRGPNPRRFKASDRKPEPRVDLF